MKKFKYLVLLAIVLFSACERDEVFDDAEQLAIDIALIEEYLAENNIVADTLPSGIRIAIQDEGTGSKPEFGSSIFLHYRGYFLDGTQFDTSLDNPSPWEVVLGRGDVIRGWTLALPELAEGSNATIYIPSGLAYGNLRRLNIPPNSVLIFDLNILDVRL